MKLLSSALTIIIIFLIIINKDYLHFGNIFTSKSEETIRNTGGTMLNTIKILSPYERLDVRSIPLEPQLTDEERKYLTDIVISLSNVISERSTLEAEEKTILGKGQYFWPKDPEAPTHLIKTYKSTNFRMSGLTLTVMRKSKTSKWDTIGLSIQPRNFPHGVYLIDLPDKTYEDYSLQKVVREHYPNEQVENPNVYYFKHKMKGGVSMKIHSPYEAQSKIMAPPKKFYAIVFNRE